MVSIAHKIEIKPNNKQKTHFRKAFGCARLAYNWGLAEWKRMYEEYKKNPEAEKPSAFAINKRFNNIKKTEYPFVYDVSKYATQRTIVHDLKEAFDKFFAELKNGEVCYPRFKKKKEREGSFYLGNEGFNKEEQKKLLYYNPSAKFLKGKPYNENQKHQYLHVANLGYVKMTQPLRFHGKINGITISRSGSKFYASFSMEITEEEYLRTHPNVKKSNKDNNVGIDLGVKEALILSDGIFIENPKIIKKYERKITKVSRQLDKRSHPKTKEERMAKKKCSENYKKLALRLADLHRKVADTRRDFIHKTTTILTTHYTGIIMEDLNVKGMTRNHRLAKPILDVSFGEINRQITYKAKYNKVKVIQADRFYPSSKTCSVCGYVNKDLKLSDRVYRCPQCGCVLDRDWNASRNLLSLATKENKRVGAGDSEFTPVDLTALLSRFTKNGIATSKVETGIQQKNIQRTVAATSISTTCVK